MDDKIYFLQFSFYSELLEQDITENIPVKPVIHQDDQFTIAGIPVFTPGIALGDTVSTAFDDNNQLVFSQVLTTSGNSTVWVVQTAEKDLQVLHAGLTQFGCGSNIISEHFFTVNIPAASNFLQICNLLNEWKSNGSIDYEISCLSAHHQY